MSETAAPSLLGKIAGYTEILSKDPYSTIFVPLSEAYRQMGLLDDALEIASKGVQANPSYEPGYTAIGRTQAQRGAHDEAAAAFEKALELDRDSLAALKGLASIRLKTGEKEQARLLLLRAAALRPNDAAVHKTLRQLSGPASAPSSPSVEIPQAARSSSPSPKSSPKAVAPISTPTIAELYIKQGFPKRALRVYRDLLESDPHNEAIRQKLIALKKRLAAGGRPVSAGDPGVSAQDSDRVEAIPAQPAAEAAGYAEKLELWLTSIQKRRKHVQ